MRYSEYTNVGDFLSVVKPNLLRDECVNSLMLGICLRIVERPDYESEPPHLATVTSGEELHLAAVRTPPRKSLHIYAADLENPAGLEVLVEGLSSSGVGAPEVFAIEPLAKAFAGAWSAKTGVSAREGTRQRIHRLERVVHPTYPPGDMRQATRADLDLVREWASGFHQDCFHEPPYERTIAGAERRVSDGTLFLWVDETPRAMAARNRPTPTGECISYVYTPPEHRNHGYASAVVARLSQKILDEDKSFCTLYTDLGNPTSNSIYRKLGYVGMADFLDIELGEG